MLNDVVHEDPVCGVLLNHKVYKNVKTLYFGGATAVGFRPNHQSKTQSFKKTYDKILSMPISTKLFFNFGQVDMDVVYPYKCISNNEWINIDTYIDSVLQKYFDGLLEIKKLNSNICIIGINPPSTRTVRILLSNTGQQRLFDRYKDLCYDFLLESRTAHFRRFNEKLKAIATQHGFMYIDFWDKLCDDDSSVTRILRFKYFRPDYDDNHIFIENDTDWNTYFWNRIDATCKTMK